MEGLPLFVGITFGLTTLVAILLFCRASNHFVTTFLLLILWFNVQSFIGQSGFYLVTDTIPPRFLLLILPPLILITGLFMTKKGRQYLDGIDIKKLTLLHIVRIPVELVLYWLFVYKAVPQLMTFEGRNFDILSGITAPLVYYFGFVKKRLGKDVILLWNFICLGLLLNIVANAILSAPFPFQQFAFDQPNIAVLNFPFNLLPALVVPLVFLAHLVTIRQVLISDKQS